MKKRQRNFREELERTVSSVKKSFNASYEKKKKKAKSPKKKANISLKEVLGSYGKKTEKAKKINSLRKEETISSQGRS